MAGKGAEICAEHQREHQQRQKRRKWKCLLRLGIQMTFFVRNNCSEVIVKVGGEQQQNLS